MSSRTGRPKSENPKDIRFSVRMDADTFTKLQERCQKESITVAQAIRTAIHQFLEREK